MNEAEVRTTHQPARAQLAAAGLTPRPAACLSALLLLAAGCTAAGDPVRVVPMDAWHLGGTNGGSIAPPPGPTSGGAGTGVPGTGGATPVGAGTGQPITTAGTGGRGNPSTAGTGAVTPVAGTGGVAPMTDGGLPPFNAGTDPARNRVQAGQICARVSAIQCAAEVHCCSKPKKNLEGCKAELTKACSEGLYLDDVSKNAVAGYSPTQTEAVLNKIEEYSKTCDPSIIAWMPQPDGLLSMFQGTVAPGGMCKPSGLILTGGSFVAAMASCEQSTTTSCLMTGSGMPPSSPQNATCAPRAAAGGKCFYHTNCGDGLFCPNPQQSYAGATCTPQKPTGAACSEDAECATFTCRSDVCLVATVDSAFCVST